jgi:hypothetical protein
MLTWLGNNKEQLPCTTIIWSQSYIISVRRIRWRWSTKGSGIMVVFEVSPIHHYVIRIRILHILRKWEYILFLKEWQELCLSIKEGVRKWEYIQTLSSSNPNSYTNLEYNKANGKLFWWYNKSAQYCATKLGHQISEVITVVVNIRMQKASSKTRFDNLRNYSSELSKQINRSRVNK